MPFYEYQCQACGQHHEALQKISDPPARKCPACGKPKLKRLISAPVFRLKGSGWYETDFKSDKESKRNLHGEEAKAATGDADAKKTEAAPAGGKADAKPETKVETKAEPKSESKAATTPAPRSTRKASARSRKPAGKAPKRR